MQNIGDYYVTKNQSMNQDHVSGYSFDNIAIFNGLNTGNKDDVRNQA